MLYLDNQC